MRTVGAAPSVQAAVLLFAGPEGAVGGRAPGRADRAAAAVRRALEVDSVFVARRRPQTDATARRLREGVRVLQPLNIKLERNVLLML